jgi:formate-dependent nitrite reductase cytochrome c552 subunit
MAQPVRTLCADCHELTSVAFSTAHLEIDPGRMHCERCHEPHGADDPKLFKANAHAPFGMKSCLDCHLPPRAGQR